MIVFMNFANFDIYLLSQLQHFFKEMNKVALGVNIFEILVLAFALVGVKGVTAVNSIFKKGVPPF